MELNNAMGAKLLLQRGWKRSGGINPSQNAPEGATMDRGGQDGPAEKIAKLKGLLDVGGITQEEFDKKKDELLAQM